MSISEWAMTEERAYYTPGYPQEDPDEEHTETVLRVDPPLGDVVAKHTSEIAFLKEWNSINTGRIDEDRAALEAAQQRIAALEAQMDEEKPEDEWSTEDWRRERDALVAENEYFKAQWDSVPWTAINDAFGHFFGEAWADDGEPIDVIEKWLAAHRPEGT